MAQKEVLFVYLKSQNHSLKFIHILRPSFRFHGGHILIFAFFDNGQSLHCGVAGYVMAGCVVAGSIVAGSVVAMSIGNTSDFLNFSNFRRFWRRWTSDDVGSWSPVPQSSSFLTKKGLISLIWEHRIRLRHFFLEIRPLKATKRPKKNHYCTT